MAGPPTQTEVLKVKIKLHPSLAPCMSFRLTWQFSTWKLLWDACASWWLLWTLLFFSYTYTTHPCTHRRAAECLCNLMCQQSPCQLSYVWGLQVVSTCPRQSISNLWKSPFKPTQAQPIQTHTDSYCVSEKTSSAVAKQVLEKAQLAALPAARPPSSHGCAAQPGAVSVSQ